MLDCFVFFDIYFKFFRGCGILGIVKIKIIIIQFVIICVNIFVYFNIEIYICVFCNGI